jgi:hypothetical protein
MESMGYVGSALLPGERIAYSSRLHWTIYAPRFTALAREFAFNVPACQIVKFRQQDFRSVGGH